MPPKGRQPGAGAPEAHRIEQLPPPNRDAEWTPVPGTIQHVEALGGMALSVEVASRPPRPYEQSSWHQAYVQGPMEEMQQGGVVGVQVEAGAEQGTEETAVFESIRFNAGLLRVPNHLDKPGDPDTSRIVQSVEMVTRTEPRAGEPEGRRHRARLVDMRYVYGGAIAREAEKAEQSVNSQDGTIARKALETTLRVMTNKGANGLHHIFQTVIGGEIAYYSVSQGGGPQVFIAKVGEMPRDKDTPHLPGEAEGDTIPVYGIIATTTSQAAAQRLFKDHLGGTPADVRALSSTGKK